METRVRIGTSGWVYPHWREVFYPRGLPQDRWFGWYAQAFDTVEINSTFYRLPEESVFRHWRQEAPASFCFAVKANRYLTHLKKLKGVREPLAHFLSRARLLEPHLGPILWQLPPHWRVDLPRLEGFLALLPRDIMHVFEFRDRSWLSSSVRGLLEKSGVGFCIYVMPGIECPPWVTAGWVYLRFHGTGEAYGGRFGARRLRPWAARIQSWIREGRRVYAYFNNDAFGYAVQDARTLRELLRLPERSGHRQGSDPQVDGGRAQSA